MLKFAAPALVAGMVAVSVPALAAGRSPLFPSGDPAVAEHPTELVRAAVVRQNRREAKLAAAGAERDARRERAERRRRVRARRARRVAARPVAVPPALQAIAACESGGNPSAVGGGGAFRGKYQFDRGTWAGVGGSGDPAAAPEAEQDRRAAMLYARAGSSPWPVCGR